MEISKPLANHAIMAYNTNATQMEDDAPLDLSEEGVNHMDDLNNQRFRKVHDIRRVFRLPPPQIIHVASDMPEQTEPEDLSMHTTRQELFNHSNPSSAAQSPEPNMLMMHDDLDFDELDDAATLYMRQQQQFKKNMV